MTRDAGAVGRMPQTSQVSSGDCGTSLLPAKGAHLYKRVSQTNKTARSARPVEAPVSTPQPQSGPNTSSYLDFSMNSVEGAQRLHFYHDLHDFMASIGQPIQRLPTLGFKELDLWILYKEVTNRRGVDVVIAKKQWKEVADALNLPASCTDSGFRLRLHYTKYLEQYERSHFTPPPEMPMLKKDNWHRKSNIGQPDRKRKSSAATHSAGVDQAQHSTCDSYENLALSPLTSCDSPELKSPVKRQRSAPGTIVNLSKLEDASLERYRECYQLHNGQKLTKDELVWVVSQHFASNLGPIQQEQQTLLAFISALRRTELTT